MITQKAKYHIKAKHSMNAEEQLVDKEIREAGLHIKHEWQIAQMLTSHAQKLTRVEIYHNDLVKYPGWRIRKYIKDGYSEEKAQWEYQRELSLYQNKVEKLNEVVYLLDEDIRLRLDEKVDRSPIGTTYYIDADNGNDVNDGLSAGSGNAWASLDKFTENARAVGDIAKIRRGTTATINADASDLAFTSDGDANNPIVIEADYDDDWGDFSTLDTGATFTFGSKTVTIDTDIGTHSLDLELSSTQYASITDASQTGLDITGDISIGAWVNIEQLPSTAASDFTIASKYNVTGDDRSYRLIIANADDTLQFQYSADGTFTNITTVKTSGAIVVSGDVGNWVYIMATIDVSAKTGSVYKNSVSQAMATSTGTDTAIYNGGGDFIVGARHGGADYFDGKIAEVVVFNDIRTASEVVDNYRTQLVGTEGGLVGYWRFDNNYNDTTSNGNNLSATGSPVFSATFPSSLAAGEWIYNSTDGDDNKEFAYEIASVASSTVTLYLPFKGSTGSSKTIKVMLANPIWGDVATASGWVLSFDTDWKFQGIENRGTDSIAQISFSSADGQEILDCIFVGNGVTANGIVPNGDQLQLFMSKSRFFDMSISIDSSRADIYPSMEIRDCLFDNDNNSNASCIQMGQGSYLKVTDSEMKNATHGLEFNSSNSTLRMINSQNIIFTNVTNTYGVKVGDQTYAYPRVFLEDYNGTLGDTRQGWSLTTGNPSDTDDVVSDTSTVRSGGSNTSIKITPSTRINATTWRHSKMMLLEIPIYATTSSKTYDIYFRPTALADWITDPTAAELWIELEAWGHASNNYRKITKSTGVIDMNGSLTWQALSVTVAPAQAGVAYLRVWYAKPLEDVDSFYIDPIPVIT